MILSNSVIKLLPPRPPYPKTEPSVLPSGDLRLRPLRVPRPTLVVDRALNSKSVQGEPDSGLKDQTKKREDQNRERREDQSQQRREKETYSSHSGPTRRDDRLLPSKHSIRILPKDLIQLVLQLRNPKPQPKAVRSVFRVVRSRLFSSLLLNSPPHPPATFPPSPTQRKANSSIQGYDRRAAQALAQVPLQ